MTNIGDKKLKEVPMSILLELLAKAADPATKNRSKLKTLEVDQYVKDTELKLSTNLTVTLSSLVNRNPVLLVFIRGTWCPFCRLHMSKLSKWKASLESKMKITTIVVSSEPMPVIREWLDKNPLPYIFASDIDYELADYFGVRLPDQNYFEGATFLINTDSKVSLAYVGKRSKKNFDVIDKSLNKIQNSTEGLPEEDSEKLSSATSS